MTARVLGVLLATIALSTAPAAAQTASKCTAQKYKAAGRYAQDLANCRAKTLAKGLPAETLCAAKALLRLQKAFLKAEQKDDCLGTRDQTFSAEETEAYLETLEPILEAKLFCCDIAGLGDACTWLEDAASCAVTFGGTLGAPGSVCDGATGSCIAPPATGGACCTFENLEFDCQGGIFASNVCQINGGTFTANAVCVAGGTCEEP